MQIWLLEEADSGGNDWGKYEIPTQTNLKEYYVIKEEYTDDFGTGKVIAPIKGTTGTNDRFYVMALEDIDNKQHSWWKNASGYLDKNYFVNFNANDFAIAGAEPTGLLNTRRMMECYENENINGTQVAKGTNDMWGLIEDKYNDGWFVPSKSEWAAFGAAFGIDKNNYDEKYKLRNNYWSSSENGTNYAYYANFLGGSITYYFVYDYYYVRLSTTF